MLSLLSLFYIINNTEEQQLNSSLGIVKLEPTIMERKSLTPKGSKDEKDIVDSKNFGDAFRAISSVGKDIENIKKLSASSASVDI